MEIRQVLCGFQGEPADECYVLTDGDMVIYEGTFAECELLLRRCAPSSPGEAPGHHVGR